MQRQQQHNRVSRRQKLWWGRARWASGCGVWLRQLVRWLYVSMDMCRGEEGAGGKEREGGGGTAEGAEGQKRKAQGGNGEMSKGVPNGAATQSGNGVGYTG